MNSPDGKPMHAELTLRGTTLMLGPENAAMGKRTATSVGASPAGLYIYVDNVDKVVDKETKLGATSQGPVIDMFWGDRCGTIVDPDGYTWMVRTHKAEPMIYGDVVGRRDRPGTGEGVRASFCKQHAESTVES